MQKSEFITLLKKEVSIENLAFNNENVCRLILEKHLIVDLEWIDNKALFIYASIGSSTHLDIEQMQLLLQANAYGQGTSGAILATDKNAEEVILHRFYELETLNTQTVFKQMEQLINDAIEWKQVLLNGVPQTNKNTLLPDPSGNIVLV